MALLFGVDVQHLSLLVSLASLALTFWYYTNMVLLTQHLQEANTMNVIYADYSSPKTLAALEYIEDFIERYGIDEYPFAFLQQRKQGSEEGRQLDRARRHLTQWFSRVEYFYHFGYLKREALRKFPGAERAKYFLDRVEPLEFVSRKTTRRKHAGVFDFLRALYHLKKHTLRPAFVEKVSQLLDAEELRRGDHAGSRPGEAAAAEPRAAAGAAEARGEGKSDEGQDAVRGEAGASEAGGGPDRAAESPQAEAVKGDTGDAGGAVAAEAEAKAAEQRRAEGLGLLSGEGTSAFENSTPRRRFNAYAMESTGAEGEEDEEDDDDSEPEARGDTAEEDDEESAEDLKGEAEEGTKVKPKDAKDDRGGRAGAESQKASERAPGGAPDGTDQRGEEL
ncbi:hypothetical protein BESB_052660 [Besnoitia besnoiti]|uniref:Uncharacterized protein n=1 Tax=Besnoitia besnoiti TaxID=94643 RepID=A0A2A9MCB0_BESBE|nr:hypothetical protein BESB_052660 [Besnoitia besnoiti]PFH35615.1 hypothetical protein BESB_052660 [Besnoitia besnoiti]